MAEHNYASKRSAVSSEAGSAHASGGPRRRKSTRVPVTRGGVWNDATQRLRILKQDTEDYVWKNPTKAVFTALGIGFVLALMRRA